METVNNQWRVCSFFGHRKITVTEKLRYETKNVIEQLINNNTSTFLFGSNSEFNDFCHSIVSELKNKYPLIKRIAYTCKSESCVLESERKKMGETVLSRKSKTNYFDGF